MQEHENTETSGSRIFETEKFCGKGYSKYQPKNSKETYIVQQETKRCIKIVCLYIYIDMYIHIHKVLQSIEKNTIFENEY